MKKSIIFLPIILVYLIFAIFILFNNVSQIPGGAEMAGIIIYFNAIFTSFIIFIGTIGLIILITQIFKKSKYKDVMIVIVFLLGLIYTHSETLNICVYEDRNISVYSRISKQKEELQEVIKLGKKALSKSDNVYPEREIILKDSIIIMNFLNDFLDSCQVALNPTEKIYFNSRFNNFFELNFSDSTRSKNDSILIEKIKSSLTLDFMAYSPDEKFISTALTYSYHEDRVRILFLIGEKNKDNFRLNKLYCNYDGIDIFINKEYAFYKFFIDIKDPNKYSGCKCKVASKKFWECDHFNKVFIGQNHVYKYRVTNSFSSLHKEYRDTIGMSLVIPME